MVILWIVKECMEVIKWYIFVRMGILLFNFWLLCVGVMDCGGYCFFVKVSVYILFMLIKVDGVDLNRGIG